MMLNWCKGFGETDVYLIISPLDKWPDLIVTGRMPSSEVIMNDEALMALIPGKTLAAFALIWCEEKGAEVLGVEGKKGKEAFVGLVKKSIDLRNAMDKIDALVGQAKIKDLWPLIYHQTSWHAWFSDEGGIIELTPPALARLASQNIIKDFVFGPVSDKIKELILESVAEREKEKDEWKIL